MKQYKYLVCGLTIAFPWEVSFLPKSTENEPDAYIEKGQVRAPKDGDIGYRGPFSEVAPNHVYLNIKGVAKFSVCNGTSIIFEASPDTDLDSLNVFLLGSCLGFLLIQRHFLVLHGAVLKKHGQVAAFCGGAGSGKSTLSLLLVQSGAQFLSDNLAPLNVSSNNVTLHPSFPALHIWEASLEKLALDHHPHKRLRPELNKYAVFLDNEFFNQACNLNTICILSPWNKKEIEVVPVTGIDRVLALTRASFRQKVTCAMGLEHSHFLMVGDVSNKVNICTLHYPRDWELNEKLLTTIDQHIFLIR